MEQKGNYRGIKYLFAIQAVFWLASSVITPFLSVFLISEYSGVSIVEFGIANLIFLLSFGLLLPIVGKIEDKIEGFADELMFLNIGLFVRGLLFILMSLLDGAWALYILNFFFGVSRALFSPSYRSLLLKFASEDKKNGSAYIFSLDESLVNILAALGSGLGGYLAVILGIRPLIFVVGLCFLICMFLTIPIKRFLGDKKLLVKNQVNPEKVFGLVE